MSVPTVPIIGVRPGVTATTLQFWWSPPVSTNGELIEYLLECPESSLSFTYSPSAYTAIVTGLTIATEYTFTLKAVNASGNSPPATFRTVTTSNFPEDVSTVNVSESVSNETLTLTFTWTNPGDFAYYYAYGLRVATGTQDVIYKGTSDYPTLSYVATGLNPYQQYTFHIQRGNDAGYSPGVTLNTTRQLFDPTTVPGLGLWLDSTDVSGNGTFIPNGTLISTWKDKSGNANHATTTAPAALGTDSIGRFLQFDGSTNFYDPASSAFMTDPTNFITIFIVDNPSITTYPAALLGNTTGNMVIDYTSSSALEIYINGNSITSTVDTPPVNVWCFSYYGLSGYSSAGPVTNIFLNKRSDGPGGSYGTIATPYSMTIGANPGDYNGATFYAGKIREVLIYAGYITETQRSNISEYLYSKWYPPILIGPQVPIQHGLTQWLDATDTSTMFRNTAGTNPIGNTTSVAVWKDKSGNNNNMKITSVGGTDISGNYNATGANGLPSMDCTAGTLFTSTSLSQTTEFTLFMVAKITPPASLGAPAKLWSHGDSIVDPNLQTQLSINNLSFVLGTESDVIGNTSLNNSNKIPYITNSPTVFVATLTKGQIMSLQSYDISGTNINNTTLLNPYFNTTGYAGGQLPSAPISLGGFSYDANITHKSASHFSEVLYYQRTLSANEIAQTLTYLKEKWAINVPSNPTGPSSLPGLKVWLDAADPYTVFNNGTTLIAWKDRSGNGYDTTGVGGPGYSTSTTIGEITYSLKGITLNGSQHFTLPNGAFPSGNSPYSYYVVATNTDVSGYGYGVLSAGTNSDKVSIDVVGKNSVCFFGNSYVWQSPDGINFTNPARSSMLSPGSFIQIGWNGSYWLAVAVNLSGTAANYIVVRSNDSINWTPTGTPSSFFTSINVNNIIWTGSFWAMTLGITNNDNTPVIVSSDGITWTHATGITDYTATAIASNSDGSLILVGCTDNAYYSTDGGQSWTNNTSMTSVMPNPTSIAFDGSMWVAGSYVTTNTGAIVLAYSEDGYTWTPSANGNDVIGYDVKTVATNGTTWVAGGDLFGAPYALAYSTNGINWTGVAVIINSPITNITWNGTYFVVMGGVNATGRIFMYSTDGINWSKSINNSASQTGGFAGSSMHRSGVTNTLYPSMRTTSGSTVSISYRISSYINLLESFYSPSRNVVSEYANGLLQVSQPQSEVNYLYGANTYGGASPSSLYYSNDGVQWLPTKNDPFGADGLSYYTVWNGSYWIAIGASAGGGGAVATSSNGLTWTAGPAALETNPFYGGQGNAGAWNGSYWLVVGANNGFGSTNCIMTSSNGTTWTASTDNPFYGGFGNSVAWNGSYWVAGGSGASGNPGCLAYSSDGMTWTISSSSPMTTVTNVCWGTKWIAVGQNDDETVCIATSPDGDVWTASTTNPFTGGRGNSVAWNGSYYVAVGYNSDSSVCIAVSLDGNTWVPSIQNPYVVGQGYSVAWSGFKWVASGTTSSANYVITSEDGNYWNSSGVGNITAVNAKGSIRAQDNSGNRLGLTTNYFKGNIHEVLVFDREHGDKERKIVEDYLQAKWFPQTYTPTGTSLWLDASPSNFTYSSGTTIQTWIDKSASECDYTQDLVWARPVYEYDPVTERYGVRFGSQGVMTGLLNNTISPFGETTSWTITTVCRYTQIVTTENLYRMNNDTPAQNQIYVNNGNVINMASGGQNLTGNMNNPDASTAFICTVNVNDGSITASVNGKIQSYGSGATAMTATAYLNIGFTGLLLNTPLLAEMNGFTGYLFELIVHPVSLSAYDQQQLEGYLAWKWGIQAYLGNTYSSLPPNL